MGGASKESCGGAKDLIAGGEDEGAWCVWEASRPLPPYIFLNKQRSGRYCP